jgi:hypothetical protein
MNNNTETNDTTDSIQCAAGKIEYREPCALTFRLRAVAAGMSIGRKDHYEDPALSEIRDIAYRVDHMAKELESATASNEQLEALVADQFRRLRDMQSIENREIEKLNVVAKEMGITPNPYWRQTLHSALNYLTVILEDGTIAYDETNKLAMPVNKGCE